MKVLDYRILSPKDLCDASFTAWSRAYEYPLILEEIKKLKLTGKNTVHNTSCGGEPIHLDFCKRLIQCTEATVTNSDIIKDIKIDNYINYDITTNFDEKIKFDAVINISTIEHLPKNKRIQAITNLIKQLTPNGHLFLTFDWPRVCNKQIAEFFNSKIKDVKIRLNGENSVNKDFRYSGLNIIYLHAVNF